MLGLADSALNQDKVIVTAALRNEWQVFQYITDYLKYDTTFITKATSITLDYEDNENVIEVNTSRGVGG